MLLIFIKNMVLKKEVYMTKETIKQIVTMCVAFLGSLIGAILGC